MEEAIQGQFPGRSEDGAEDEEARVVDHYGSQRTLWEALRVQPLYKFSIYATRLRVPFLCATDECRHKSRSPWSSIASEDCEAAAAERL